jgi:hypothetical protein
MTVYTAFKGRARGLEGGHGMAFYSTSAEGPTVCVYRDGNGGYVYLDLIPVPSVCSMFCLPYDSTEPRQCREMAELIDYCSER